MILVNQEHMINSFNQMKKRGPERKRLEFQKRAIATLTRGDKHNTIPLGMRIHINRDKFLYRGLKGHISRWDSAIKPRFTFREKKIQ